MEEKMFSSLTADGELKSILEYLDKGDFKQCKRVFDKKFPKLKSEGDILNFKIVKMLLTFKMKQFEESKSLKIELKNSLTNVKNDDILRFFKNSLRDMGDDSTLAEIYKNSIKSKNFAEISKEDQREILKELTVFSEFQEIYKILNLLLDKNPHKDKNFLLILKYEIVYILCVKSKKLPLMILTKTLKEISADTNLVSQKGYIDLMIKYYLSTNDMVNLEAFLVKNISQFANAPMHDLLCEVYFKNNDLVKCVNFLLSEIINNMDKCYFVYYERLVCVSVLLLEDLGFDFSSINEVFLNDLVNKESIFEFVDFQFVEKEKVENLSKLIKFLYKISNDFEVKNFNSYKSSNIALLLMYHLAIIKGKNSKVFKSFIFEILKNLLTHAVTKQSILIEISRYFIYLDKIDRIKLFEEFSKKNNNKSKDEQIFLIKLEKLFGIYSISDDKPTIQQISDKMLDLFRIYYAMAKEINKIEKGERILGDDIIIIINEYVFELIDMVMKDKSRTVNKFLN